MDPWQILGKLLLAALYGIVGQLIHLIVGLKKTAASNPTTSLSSQIDMKRILVGLGISFAVGAIAGVLSALKIDDISTVNAATALISAGYAGTDFIEGFMK